MSVNVSMVGKWLQAQKKKWLLERGDLGTSASPGEPLRAQGTLWRAGVASHRPWHGQRAQGGVRQARQPLLAQLTPCQTHCPWAPLP